MKQAAFLRRALALLGHDARRETRQAQALAGSLLYLVAGVFAAQLLLRPVGPAAWLTFYWLLVLFVSIYTVSRSFLGQSRGLHLYYRVSVPGVAWWLTKVMTGTLMLWVLMGFCAVLMALWMGYPIQDTGLFVLTIFLGAPMLVTVLTLVSAMSQGASQPAQLMPVLGFPLLVPGLLLVHRLSKLALDGLSWDLVWTYAGAMVGLNLMLLALGVLLFPFLSSFQNAGNTWGKKTEKKSHLSVCPADYTRQCSADPTLYFLTLPLWPMAAFGDSSSSSGESGARPVSLLCLRARLWWRTTHRKK